MVYSESIHVKHTFFLSICDHAILEGELNFNFGRGMRSKGFLSHFHMSCYYIKEWIGAKQCFSQNWFLAQMRLPELDFFGQFIGLKTENLPNLGILNRICGNLWFLV